MVKCDKCGEMMGNGCTVCSKCGAPIKQSTMNSRTIVLIVILCLVIFGTFAFIRNQKIKEQQESEAQFAQYLADETERMEKETAGYNAMSLAATLSREFSNVDIDVTKAGVKIRRDGNYSDGKFLVTVYGNVTWTRDGFTLSGSSILTVLYSEDYRVLDYYSNVIDDRDAVTALMSKQSMEAKENHYGNYLTVEL